MIHVHCGPLEGVLACICRTFLGVIFSMEGLAHLDLHKGLKPVGWMMCSTHCMLEKINFTFGGTWVA
jgi:hypothetical protein